MSSKGELQDFLWAKCFQIALQVESAEVKASPL